MAPQGGTWTPAHLWSTRGVGWAVRAALCCRRSPLCPALSWSLGLWRTRLWVRLPGYGMALPKHPWKAYFPGTPPTRAGAKAEPHYRLNSWFLTNCPQQARQTGMCGPLGLMRRSGEGPGTWARGVHAYPPTHTPDQGQPGWRDHQTAQPSCSSLFSQNCPGVAALTLIGCPIPQHFALQSLWGAGWQEPSIMDHALSQEGQLTTEDGALLTLVLILALYLRKTSVSCLSDTEGFNDAEHHGTVWAPPLPCSKARV